MKSGFRVFWTDNALSELQQTFDYLRDNFGEAEVRRLAREIEFVLKYISNFPRAYPESEKQKGVRKAVILKFNSLYYRSDEKMVEILSFFSNRQNPEKIKFDH